MSTHRHELPPELTFASELTELVHSKMVEAVRLVPFSEEDSVVAVTAGWFCIEPPTHYPVAIQGSDEISLSYIGAQDSPGNVNESDSGTRSMVISLRLFKRGLPFTFEEGLVPTEYNNSYSILSGPDSPPTIVNQIALAAITEELEYSRSSLGNWEALAIARLTKEGVDMRQLNAEECNSIIEAVSQSQVDLSTLIRFLKEKLGLPF